MRKRCVCTTCGSSVIVDHGRQAYCRKHVDMAAVKRAATWWECDYGRTADEPPIDRRGHVWRKFICAWLVSELSKGELCMFMEDVE